jgi:chorismate mutase
MFVSESKFRSAPRDFIPHIQSDPPNREALAGLITKPEVERRLLIRLGNKARLYGGELDAEGKFMPPEKESGRGKIDVDQVVALYRDYVIPLTKDVEVSI